MLSLKIGDRRARLVAHHAVDLTVEIVAMPDEKNLQFAALEAREARIVGGPSRRKRGTAAQPIGEQRNRQGVGVGRVVGIEHIEIMGDEKGWSLRSRRQKQAETAVTVQGRTVDMGEAPRAPKLDRALVPAARWPRI